MQIEKTLKNDIQEFKKDLKKEAIENCGWEKLTIIGINKYGIEAVVRTDKGNIKMSMRELMTQYYFILRVFETTGIYLKKQKDFIYNSWLEKWVENLIDMGTDSGTTFDLIQEALKSYIETAQEQEEVFLLNGEPIIYEDYVAFRSNEFSIFIRKRYNINYTNDQLHSLLRDLDCNPQRLGKNRIRAWLYKIPLEEKINLFTK